MAGATMVDIMVGITADIMAATTIIMVGMEVMVGMEGGEQAWG
jgi:hypothetical protein